MQLPAEMDVIPGTEQGAHRIAGHHIFIFALNEETQDESMRRVITQWIANEHSVQVISKPIRYSLITCISVFSLSCHMFRKNFESPISQSTYEPFPKLSVEALECL